MILVDTSILSLAFRRKRRDLNLTERRYVFAINDLLTRGEVAIIGLIRQELLSGIANGEQFRQLNDRLDFLYDLPLTRDIFVLAADFYNICRSRGIASGDIDMAIAAAAHIHNVPLFTSDPDFTRYAKYLPITLYDIK